MKKIYLWAVLSFASLLFVACSRSYDDALINDFVSALNNEFTVNKDIMTVKSVIRNSDVVTIDAYAVDGKASAELLYEVLDAARRCMVDNPTRIPDEYKEVLDELVAADISFNLSISDVGNSKKYVVKYSAKEFMGMYVLDDAVGNPEIMQELFKYIPFEKLVLIVNGSAGGELSPFLCEDGFLYMVLPMQSDEYQEFKEMYDFDSKLFASMIKKSIFENLDESSRRFLELAHENNYKLALKLVSQGYEPLLVSME